MLETVMKHNVIFYVMGSLMAVGILAKLVSYFTARKLVKAAGDIQKSNQKLMRLVKAKFEHASMVSDKVKNVEAFVNKYFYGVGDEEETETESDTETTTDEETISQ